MAGSAMKDMEAFRLTSLDREILPRCANDIDLWARGYFGVSLFPYQRHFYHRPQHDKLLVAGIRTGKSELASLGELHVAQYNPHSRILNTSISSEQAKIVFTKCVERCKSPKFEHWVEHIQSSPYPMIRLVNKAELWFKSIGFEGELLRGFEFDLINFDEVAYCTREASIKMLRGRLLGINPYTNAPRLGLFWQMTSPKGQGWLHERWKKGDPAFLPTARPDRYLSLRATIFDNPLLSKEQIAETMADYTEAMIRQELLGEFLDNQDAIFNYEQIMDACSDEHREVKWIYEQIKLWNEAHGHTDTIHTDAGLSNDITHYECEVQAGHQYINSWDLGSKPTRSGRNAMVGQIWDITHQPWSMHAFYYKEGMGYVAAKSLIEKWNDKYSGRGSLCHTIIDGTGKGDVVKELMDRDRSVDDLEGVVYSSTSKPNMIHAGQIALEDDCVRFPFIQRKVNQLSTYVHYDEKIAQDIVMSYCQAMYRAREVLHLSDRSEKHNRTIAATPMYNARRPEARFANPRYVAARESTRIGRLRQDTSLRRRR